MKSHQKLVIARGSVNRGKAGSSVSDTPFSPGDRVVILDVFGKPTGVHCTVKEAERYSVAVTWEGGDGIIVGRSWLRKVS